MATFRRRESGRWQAIIRRDGYSQSATFGSKSAATAWARRMEREIEDNVASGRRENRTLGELLDAVEVAARRPYGRSRAAAIDAMRRAIGHLPAALSRDEAPLSITTTTTARGRSPPPDFRHRREGHDAAERHHIFDLPSLWKNGQLSSPQRSHIIG